MGLENWGEYRSNRKSFVLNLKEKTLKSPVGEAGDKISGFPCLFSDGRLIFFESKTLNSTSSNFSRFKSVGRVYLSD